MVNIVFVWQDVRHHFSSDHLLLATVRVDNFSFKHFFHWRNVSGAEIITTHLLTLPALFPSSNELLSHHFIVEKDG